VDRGTAQSAVSRIIGDLAFAWLAGTDQPAAGRERGQICRRRYVRQGVRRKSTKEVIADAKAQLTQIFKPA
jgi:hypothetical protein